MTTKDCMLRLDQLRHRLLSWLKRQFVHICPGRAEDAVSELYMAALRRPSIFEDADQHGEEALWRLACCVVWRAANDQLRRRHCLDLRLDAAKDQVGRPPGQEVLVDFPRDLDSRMWEIALATCRRQAVPLRRALEEKLLEGESDAVLAARHQVQREQVSRAWVALRRNVGLRAA
jgi:DNA-directed RNA polymerase specialized sigma24 family protein